MGRTNFAPYVETASSFGTNIELTCCLVNSMLLDVTGILFAAQLVTLLTVGPYADYGNWRPWIMISTQS